MTIEQFIWWSHGAIEVFNPEILTAQQVQEIKNHISLVKNDFIPAASPNIVGNGPVEKPIFICQTKVGSEGLQNLPIDVSKSGCHNEFKITGSVVALSGFNSNLWAKPLQDKVYITISPNPKWNSDTSYSSYYNQNHILDGLGIMHSGIYPAGSVVVIDNALSQLNQSQASSIRLTCHKENHLVGLPRSGPGIANLGVVSPSHMLIC